MATIPSNYSLEEILTYYPSGIPEELKDRLEALVEEKKELQHQVNNFDRVEEMLGEQLEFRNEFIRSTVARCESATKCKELIKEILLELEESYIEL